MFSLFWEQSQRHFQMMLCMLMIHQDHNGHPHPKSTISLTLKINVNSHASSALNFSNMSFLEITSIFLLIQTAVGKGLKIDSEKPVPLKGLKLNFTLINVIILLLLVIGSITLIWVGHLIWKDITVWKKDFSVIFFESRRGENISLGIGLQVIHYYLIGILTLFSATGLLLRKIWNNKKTET
jgi:hypothetical protein